MNKTVKTNELFECNVPYIRGLFIESVYPWDMLTKIKDYISALTKHGIPDFYELKPGVLVGQHVTIAETAVIEAPAIIGHGTEIRPGAYIRGNVITGERCVIGNSTELKNCILLDRVQVPHYNYVGDSVLGNRAHMGAGSICSNLKSDGRSVAVHGDTDIETGLRKLGGILGDGADIGCSCVLNPGTVVGKNTSVYPLTALRGVYPENCIVKSNDSIVERITEE